MVAQSPTSGQHLDVLDGLRGIAIAMVVWFHLWLITWLEPPVIRIAGHEFTLAFIPVTGFLGVELFFFISGFCLFFPYARTMLEGKARQTLRTYAYRRAIKILPSYWLLIAILALTILPWGNPATPWHVFTHLAFIHTLYHATYGSIAGVLWSLGVEVQFYLVFPLIAAAFMRRPLWTYAALACISLAYRLWTAQVHRDDYHFWLNQMPGFLDLFGAGMLAAYLYVLGRSKLDWQRYGRIATLVAIGASSTVAAMVYHLYMIRYGNNAIYDWQVVYRTAFGLGLTAVTVGSLFAARWWQLLLGNPVLLFLSAVSYNMYLWHQILMLGLHDRRIPPYATLDAHDDGPWKWVFTAIAIPVVIAVSAALTFGFERPFLRRGPRLLVELPRAIGRRLGVSLGDRGEAEALH